MMNKRFRLRTARPVRRPRIALGVERLEARDVPSVNVTMPGLYTARGLVQVSGATPFTGYSATPNSEVEPFLAVNPTTPANLVSVFQQDRWTDGGGSRGLVVGVSTDWGATWKEVTVAGLNEANPTVLPDAPAATLSRYTDAWLAFAPDGSLYLSALAFDPGSLNGTVDAILVSKSANGGQTWGQPVVVAENAGLTYNPNVYDDKPSVSAVADPTFPNAIDVNVAWSRQNLSGGPDAAMFARSIDGGQTWLSSEHDLNPGSRPLGHEIVAGQGGTLLDFYTVQSASAHVLTLARSSDGGQTWSFPGQAVAAINPISPYDPDHPGTPVRTSDNATDQLFDVAADPASGNLYAVWEDSFGGTSFNSIALTTSADGGLTWTAPVPVNRTPVNAAQPGDRQAFVPSVAVAPDGTVAVTYYDFRNNTAAAGLATDYWAIYARPGAGQTPGQYNWREVRLTDASLDMEKAPYAAGYFLGDYAGLAAGVNGFYAAFAQPHGSDPASVFVRELHPGGVAFGDTFGQSPPDPMVAAGANYVLETVNASLAVYDKAGAWVSSQRLEGLFATLPLTPVAGNLFDPFVFYDDQAQRFVVGALDTHYDSASKNYYETLDLAVSAQGVPAGWELQQINLGEKGTRGTLLRADFPRAGWNGDAYVVAVNTYSQDFSTFDHVQVVGVKKASVTDGNPGTLVKFVADRAGGSNFTLVPAAMHADAQGNYVSAKEWFVEESGYSNFGKALNVAQMTYAWTATGVSNLKFTDNAVSLPTAARYVDTPYATQPDNGGPIDVGDTRFLSADWRGGRLVATQTVGEKADGLTHARWYDFNTTGKAPALKNWGDVRPGQAGANTYHPSAAIAPGGTVGMTFAESSPNEYLSTYVTGMAPGETVVQAPVLVKAGERSSVDLKFGAPSRAGDFSGVAVDPVTGEFWAVNQYANQELDNASHYWANWGTWITRFTVSPALPAPTATAAAPADLSEAATASPARPPMLPDWLAAVAGADDLSNSPRRNASDAGAVLTQRGRAGSVWLGPLNPDDVFGPRL
jgi:hypothetical protein